MVKPAPDLSARHGMEAVIIQHLLSTELAHMENELARKSDPSGPAIHLLQAHTHRHFGVPRPAEAMSPSSRC